MNPPDKQTIIALRRGALIHARDTIEAKRKMIADLMGESDHTFRGMGYAVNVINSLLKEDEALVEMALAAS